MGHPVTWKGLLQKDDSLEKGKVNEGKYTYANFF